MKLSRKTFLWPVLAVLLIAVSDLTRSAEVSSTDDQPADLNHLISILDVNGSDKGLTATSKSAHQSIVSDQLKSSTIANPSPLTKTIIRKRKFRKIRKPVSVSSSTILQPTTPESPPQLTSPESPTTTEIEATTFPTTSEIITPPPTTPTPSVVDLGVSSAPTPTTPTTTPIPTVKVSNFPIQPDAERREDVNMDEIAQPSQLELAQQLSLLNSLLTSLGDNATATANTNAEIINESSSSIVTPTTPKTLVTNASPSESPPNQQDTTNAQAVTNQQTLAVLNSIFGGGGPGGISNEDATAALIGLGLDPSNVGSRQIEPGTEGAKALSEFLFQAAAIEAAQRGNNGQNGNANNLNGASAAAANNQISSLVSLLGTLNAIGPQGLNEQGNNPLQGLLNPGQIQGFQQSQITDPQQVLAVLAQQQQRGQGQGQPNSFSHLFSHLPNQGGGQAQPGFDLGSLIAQGQGALGGGGGILSTIGSGITSLGSSMFTTFSNLLSGSGIGGKPRVRGVDTRLGLGYRFGNAADAQIMWDVGPQLFTEPVKNEQRSPTMTKKSHTVVDTDETDKLIRSLIGGGDTQPSEGLPASKRALQLQTKKSVPIPPKKPFSLLHIWNAGKEPKSKQVTNPPNTGLQIPLQLLTPPVALNLNDADRLQMARNKSFKKRSSATPLKNFYSKPDDNPLAGHSTLTAYEQMLITKGKNLGFKFRDMIVVEEAPIPTTGRSVRRKRPPPTTPIPENEDEEENVQQDQLPTAEYGNNQELSQSVPIPEKKTKKGKKSRGKKKRPLSMRPRPPNDWHKWKPRMVVDEDDDEDSEKGESQTEQKIRSRDESRVSSSREQKETKKRPQGNKSRERELDHDHDHDDHKTPCSKLRAEKSKVTPLVEPLSSHSLDRPQYNDNRDTELNGDYLKVETEADEEYEDDDYEAEVTEKPQTESYNNESERRPNKSSKEKLRASKEKKYGSREKTYGSREKDYRSREKIRGSKEKYRGSKEHRESKEKQHHDKLHHDYEDRPYKNLHDAARDKPYEDHKYYELGNNPRPRHKENKDIQTHNKHQTKYNPRPPQKQPQIPKARKKSQPKFSLSRIFHYWMGTGRRTQKVKKLKQPSPDRDRGHMDDLSSDHQNDDYDIERFTYKKPDLSKAGSRSDDPFRARNRRRPFKRSRRPRPSISPFNHKMSSPVPMKRVGSSSSPYDFIQTYSPEINPEANDSFLRRNQISLNRLKEIQRQKLIQSQSTDVTTPGFDDFSDPSPTLPSKSGSSVMTFVKNYFASKTPKTNHNSKKIHRPSSHANSSPHSISTLAKLISNPSALNPLKMLPIRRNRVPPTQSQIQSKSQSSQVRHKLAVVNGKLQIVNVTTTTTEAPVIHIGDDMSFEELTEVLGAVKKRRKNQKIKLKTTTTKRPLAQSKKDYEYEDYSEEEPDFVVKAEEKVDTGKKTDNNVEEEFDPNDGLKGIFIDIESGEVNVMKPVASLTSFLPPVEEEPPSLQEVMTDDLDDTDGDGVADKEIQRKDEIFSGIQTELKKNYDKMKKAHEISEAKKRRKEAFVAKGLDESMDVVSKYFDMVPDDDGGK